MNEDTEGMWTLPLFKHIWVPDVVDANHPVGEGKGNGNSWVAPMCHGGGPEKLSFDHLTCCLFSPVIDSWLASYKQISHRLTCCSTAAGRLSAPSH